MNQIEANEMTRKVVTIIGQMSTEDLFDVLLVHAMGLLKKSYHAPNITHDDEVILGLAFLLENLEGIRKLKEAGRN